MRQLTRIGIDLDGVITNFDKAFRHQVLRPFFGMKGKFEVPQEFNYGLSPKQMERALAHLDQLRGFWADLEPYPNNLIATIKFIHTMPKDCQLLFITQRHGDPYKTWSETLLWLEKYGLMVPYKTRLLLCPADGSLTKGYFCAIEGVSYILEDYPPNLDDIRQHSPRTIPILLARPWNRADRKRFIVVRNVQEFFERVTRALTKGEKQ